MPCSQMPTDAMPEVTILSSVLPDAPDVAFQHIVGTFEHATFIVFRPHNEIGSCSGYAFHVSLERAFVEDFLHLVKCIPSNW